jgi:hypothetical protein
MKHDLLWIVELARQYRLWMAIARPEAEHMRYFKHLAFIPHVRFFCLSFCDEIAMLGAKDDLKELSL